jgi:hypothetical protein
VSGIPVLGLARTLGLSESVSFDLLLPSHRTLARTARLVAGTARALVELSWEKLPNGDGELATLVRLMDWPRWPFRIGSARHGEYGRALSRAMGSV